MLASQTLLALACTIVSFLDVFAQSIDSKGFWAVRALLPDTLVNCLDVAIQIVTFKQFRAMWALLLLPDALVNFSDVATTSGYSKLL